jgi:ATP-dependent protease HslVU (ClpYQ) peptidase subunit
VEVVKGQAKELNKLAADAIIPAMPGHVVQAFTLLKSSPEAQVCNRVVLLCLSLIRFSCYDCPS